ncbi:transaldolase family protein [Microbacterium sp. ABRD28]|uniref:transaldolase family protein n=1 Tax=Microbacterium sp. ABRD28 TaxID=2268461 RepID=UPI000F54D66D|nr:transaldolase family protein [Microbacterium sp. ABRD28]AZC12640.1 transaldolase [Microbacterium sp. ABRD28]
MIAAPVLYVDSADTVALSPLLRDGLVRGVTTNPTILERSGRRLVELADLYARWIEEGAEEVFFQAWGTDAAQLRRAGEDLRELGDRVGVKVPATRAGFAAAKILVRSGATVLVTAVYSVPQALVAASIGARFIAPYLGRLTDAGVDGHALIGRMQAVCAGSGTDVLAASLRSPEDLVALREAGVGYFTAAPAVLEATLLDPTSERSAAEFEDAIARLS